MLASWNQIEAKSTKKGRYIHVSEIQLSLVPLIALLIFHRLDIVVAIQIKASLSEQVTHLAEMATMK
jgi:hypothetical protein